MRVDLEALDRALAQPAAQEVLEDFLQACRAHPGPYKPDLPGAREWGLLQLKSPVADRLHENTLARLKATSGVYSNECQASIIAAFQASEPDLARMIMSGNAAIRGVKRSEFRVGPVAAPAGYTALVAHFPKPASIRPGLLLAQKFRTLAPLSHPVWNALLLQLLLLRLHPFMDGNGRTFRALVNYELQCVGILGKSPISFRKVLDANRANDILLRLIVSKSDDTVTSVCEALCFDLTLLRLAIEAGSGKSITAPSLSQIAPSASEQTSALTVTV